MRSKQDQLINEVSVWRQRISSEEIAAFLEPFIKPLPVQPNMSNECEVLYLTMVRAELFGQKDLSAALEAEAYFLLTLYHLAKGMYDR